MRTRLLIGVAAIAVSTATQAHPGHPALGAKHDHDLVGIDPAYALPVALVLAAAGLLWRMRRVRGPRRR